MESNQSSNNSLYQSQFINQTDYQLLKNKQALAELQNQSTSGKERMISQNNSFITNLDKMDSQRPLNQFQTQRQNNQNDSINNDQKNKNNNDIISDKQLQNKNNEKKLWPNNQQQLQKNSLQLISQNNQITFQDQNQNQDQIIQHQQSQQQQNNSKLQQNKCEEKVNEQQFKQISFNNFNSSRQSKNSSYNNIKNSHMRQSRFNSSQIKKIEVNNFNGITRTVEEENQLIKKLQLKYKRARYLGKMDKIKAQMTFLANQTSSRRFKQMNLQQFSKVRDKSLFYVDKSPFKFKIWIQKFLSTLDQAIGTIFFHKPFHPFSKFVTLFEILETILIIVDFVMYTLFCFYNYFNESFFFNLCLASICIFGIGTYLRLNTAFFDQGKLIFERKRIIKKYRREVLFNDIIGYIGFLYQLFKNDNEQLTKQLSFLLILKYQILLDNISKLEDKMNLTGHNIQIWSLIKLLCTTLALCHFIGTAYFFFSFCEKYYLEYETTWAIKNNLDDADVFTQYIQSFYWGLSLVTLIDCQFSNDIETIFCIISLILTIGIFATILSQISMVLEEMEKHSKDFKKDKEIINQFFKLNPISYDLQEDLHNYLKHYYQGHVVQRTNDNFQKLLQKFPNRFKELVQKERFSVQSQNFQILRNLFSSKVNEQLINSVVQEYYMPGQLIFQKDIYKEPSLYLVLSGLVELTYGNNTDQIQVTTRQEGDCFGVDTFFTDKVPFFSSQSESKTYTTLLTIKRQQFITILNQYGTVKDKEIFCQIKDDYLNYQNSKILSRKCLICNQTNHIEKYCKFLFYIPNRVNLALRLNHNQMQMRFNDVQRTNYKNIKATIEISLIQNRSELILQNPDMRKYLKVIQEHQKQLERQIQDENQQYQDCLKSENDSEVYEQNDDDFFLGNSRKIDLNFSTTGKNQPQQKIIYNDISPLKKQKSINQYFLNKQRSQKLTIIEEDLNSSKINSGYLSPFKFTPTQIKRSNSKTFKSHSQRNINIQSPGINKNYYTNKIRSASKIKKNKNIYDDEYLEFLTDDPNLDQNDFDKYSIQENNFISNKKLYQINYKPSKGGEQNKNQKEIYDLYNNQQKMDTNQYLPNLYNQNHNVSNQIGENNQRKTSIITVNNWDKQIKNIDQSEKLDQSQQMKINFLNNNQDILLNNIQFQIKQTMQEVFANNFNRNILNQTNRGSFFAPNINSQSGNFNNVNNHFINGFSANNIEKTPNSHTNLAYFNDQQDPNLEQEQVFSLNLESMKIFRYYYPYNNYDEIIKDFQQVQIKKRSNKLKKQKVKLRAMEKTIRATKAFMNIQKNKNVLIDLNKFKLFESEK